MAAVRQQRILIFVAFSIMCPLAIQAFAQDAENASNLARRAAIAGMVGDQERKADLLAAAISTDADNPAANWALGRVSVQDRWVPLQEYEQQMQEDSLLSAYHKKRQDLRDGNLTAMQLADWCRRKQLFGREKLHLTEIWNSTTATPDQKRIAARRLGMQLVRGIWMTPTEAQELRKSIRTAQQNAADWLAPTQALIKSLESTDPKRRSAAITRYQQIVDSSAILTIERLLSTRTKPFGLLAVKLIGELPEYEATQSLVRHAVYASESDVRKAAIAQLGTRDQRDAVPLLLSQLSNPLEGEFGIAVGPDGMVRQVQQVTERGREANVRHVHATTRGIHQVNNIQVNVQRGWVQSISSPDDVVIARHLDMNNYDTFEERAAAEVVMRRLFAMKRQQLIRQEVLRAADLNRSLQLRNLRSATANQRTVAALQAITDQDFDDTSPSDWWDWWAEENDRYQEEKPTYTRYTAANDPIIESYVNVGTCECFPEGTLVRTQTGFRNIESIQAGDRVLSQDTESGELHYKLVLTTTIRPPSSMVTIQLNDGAIESTNGHLFWVEEQGWTMAKNLQADDRIHGLHESHRVVSVESRANAEAYNLVVADFGTYFVGEQGILAHDNSERRRSKSITPGVPQVTR